MCCARLCGLASTPPWNGWQTAFITWRVAWNAKLVSLGHEKHISPSSQVAQSKNPYQPLSTRRWLATSDESKPSWHEPKLNNLQLGSEWLVTFSLQIENFIWARKWENWYLLSHRFFSYFPCIFKQFLPLFLVFELKKLYIKKLTFWFQLDNWNNPAWLGLEPLELNLAQLGKLQLEPITTSQ